jgi:hypothetical protein
VSEQHDDHEPDEHEPDETPGLEPDEEEEQAAEDADQSPSPSPPSSEAVLKKADSENRRYHRALDKILGPESGHRECPACQGLGITWAQEEEAPPLLKADDAEPCPSCNAYGQTITGSRNPDQTLKPCNDCGGRGWKNVTPKLEPVAPIVTPQAPTNDPIGGVFVPGRGFIPYGATEPLPGTNLGVT